MLYFRHPIILCSHSIAFIDLDYFNYNFSSKCLCLECIRYISNQSIYPLNRKQASINRWFVNVILNNKLLKFLTLHLNLQDNFHSSAHHSKGTSEDNQTVTFLIRKEASMNKQIVMKVKSNKKYNCLMRMYSGIIVTALTYHLSLIIKIVSVNSQRIC